MKKIGFSSDRRLLVGGGVVGAAALLYIAAFGRGALKACGVVEADASLENVQAFVRIGDAYLDAIANDGERSALYEELLDVRQMSLVDFVSIVDRDLVAVKRQAHEDFKRGNTVTCDGWVLAKSEARFCAKAAIYARRSGAI